MEKLNRKQPLDRPVKVLQFGEGNFLRAFVDWMIDRMNKNNCFNGAVRIIQPLEQGMGDMINAQGGLYHVIRRGVENGKQVENIDLVECVESCVNAVTEREKMIESALLPELRFVFSNTTEAGIEFKEEPYTPGQCQNTYPAKITSLLYERFAAGEKF